jgi:DNA (cytosine-5)-methyltransferase 1
VTGIVGRRSTALTVVDLFCGCGGLSLGAKQAGFSTIAAIDIDSTLQSAYRRNFPGAKAILGNVAELDAFAWNQLIGKSRPDALVGGPPCQGFSRIGRRKKSDPRNSLIHHFVRQISILEPKFFLIENVEGLLDEDNRQTLEAALESVPSTYTVLEPFIVDAADFGAATARRRVVIIGYSSNDVDEITEASVLPRRRRRVTVRDAISDLPRPVSVVQDADYGWARYRKRVSDDISAYARDLRSKPGPGLGWTEAIARIRKGYVSGSMATRHSKEVAQRYRATRAGATDATTKSFRLEWDGQCPTLRAGTGPDKGAFQAVRPLHPSAARVITVREAARLQGFPDWFVFHPTKWHSFRMIGNSVSPKVSHGLLEAVSRHLFR